MIWGHHMTPEDAWARAIKIVGGPSAMANAIGVSKQRLSQWTACKAIYVPLAARAVQVAVRRTSEIIKDPPTKRDLAPVIYPKQRR